MYVANERGSDILDDALKSTVKNASRYQSLLRLSKLKVTERSSALLEQKTVKKMGAVGVDNMSYTYMCSVLDHAQCCVQLKCKKA